MTSAAGFNVLYEAAVIKEASGVVGQGSDSETKKQVNGTKKGKEKETVQENDSANKWVWGVTLGYEDIQHIAQGVDRQLQVPHSGYDFSLVRGNFKRELMPLKPSEIDLDDPDIWFEDLSPDFPTVRDLRPHEIPLAFYQFPLFPAAVSEDVKIELRRKGRHEMQEEGDIPDSPTGSDKTPDFLFPWLRLPPKDYVRPPTSRALAARAIRLLPAPPAPNLPSDDGHHIHYTPGEITHVVLSDDSMQNELEMHPAKSGGDCDAAALNQGFSMAVAMDDNDIYRRLMMPLLSTFQWLYCRTHRVEKRVGIPTVVMSDSEAATADDDDRTQCGCDPHTGRFTVDSFSFVEDAWLE